MALNSIVALILFAAFTMEIKDIIMNAADWTRRCASKVCNKFSTKVERVFKKFKASTSKRQIEGFLLRLTNSYFPFRLALFFRS